MRPHHTDAGVILLHPDAPTKPACGAACNGCGVCCASAPCPLGIWLSRRRHGPCAALLWCAGEQRYRCGALAEHKHWAPYVPLPLLRRWIAAGQGCDCTLEPG
jgi:hypothetical protein